MFRNHTFSVISFVIVFFILYYTFIAYIGIISPGGKVYSSFLDSYANLPAWFTYFICGGAKGLLQLFGYHVYQKSLNNITIYGSRGINIIWACLGIGIMSFWVAFVTAHKAEWKYKVKWCLVGVGLITLINIIRMDLIALGFHYRWKAFNALGIHSSFTAVSYIAIVGLLLFFIKKYRIKHQKNLNFAKNLL